MTTCMRPTRSSTFRTSIGGLSRSACSLRSWENRVSKFQRFRGWRGAGLMPGAFSLGDVGVIVVLLVARRVLGVQINKNPSIPWAAGILVGPLKEAGESILRVTSRRELRFAEIWKRGVTNHSNHYVPGLGLRISPGAGSTGRQAGWLEAWAGQSRGKPDVRWGGVPALAGARDKRSEAARGAREQRGASRLHHAKRASRSGRPEGVVSSSLQGQESQMGRVVSGDYRRATGYRSTGHAGCAERQCEYRTRRGLGDAARHRRQRGHHVAVWIEDRRFACKGDR